MSGEDKPAIASSAGPSKLDFTRLELVDFTETQLGFELQISAENTSGKELHMLLWGLCGAIEKIRGVNSATADVRRMVVHIALEDNHGRFTDQIQSDVADLLLGERSTNGDVVVYLQGSNTFLIVLPKDEVAKRVAAIRLRGCLKVLEVQVGREHSWVVARLLVGTSPKTTREVVGSVLNCDGLNFGDPKPWRPTDFIVPDELIEELSELVFGEPSDEDLSALD